MTSVENLIGAFFIIGVFSYALYKESPYFRFCEHAFLGTAMGYTLVQTVKTISTTDGLNDEESKKLEAMIKQFDFEGIRSVTENILSNT